MSAYKIRSYVDFVPHIAVTQDRPTVRLAAGEEGAFAPVASPALAMQASIAARLVGQTGAAKQVGGLSALARIVICLSLAIAAWMPIAAAAFFLLN